MTLELLSVKVGLRRRMADILLAALACSAVALGQTPAAKIEKATVFKQIDKGDTLGFVVQIEGTNLNTPEDPRVILLPSTGVSNPEVPSYSPTLITMKFKAASTYVPLEVTLSYTTGPVGKAVTGTECSPDVDVRKNVVLEPENQVAKKYGHGVAKNFYVVQIGIVNSCPLPILVPLAGISLKGYNAHPFSLPHVTSIFSNDRTFSGPRAIFFNILQGAVTLGGAIEPFLASGFTQGVSIAGGGFTQGSAAIWKDLSSEQLQNLTAQSFQATEQISANGGALQKSVFFPKSKNEPDEGLAALSKKVGKSAKKTGSSAQGANKSLDELIQVQVIPVLAAAGGDAKTEP